MVEWLSRFKNGNKIVFYLVMLAISAPLLGVVFLSIISPAIRSWLVSSAGKLMKDSQKKDEVLKQDIVKLDTQVKESEKRDESLKEQLAKNDSEEVSEDWHKTWKKK